MKHIFLASTLLFLGKFSPKAACQSLPNGGFDKYQITNIDDCEVAPNFKESNNLAPIQTCPVKTDQNSAWFASHGTPELYGGEEVGNQLALSLWSGRLWKHIDGDNQIYGEGVLLSCPFFEERNRYTLKFQVVRTANGFGQNPGNVVDELKIYLVKDAHLYSVPVSYTD